MALPAPTLIHRLPNELLYLCFRYCADSDMLAEAENSRSYSGLRAYSSSIRYRSLWAISLTCSRFSQLVRPLLYADINVAADENSYEQRHRAERFYRTIKEFPFLRQLCIILTVDVAMLIRLERKCASGHFFDSLKELTLYCVQSTSGGEGALDLDTARLQSPWLSCHIAISRIPTLQKLSLDGGFDELRLRLEHLTPFLEDLTNLKVLSLSGLGCPGARERPVSTTTFEERSISDAATIPDTVSPRNLSYYQLHATCR
ncbi:hypothetical protein BT63DRAFT_419320 [Microthyrium microscopicum]|uniref:F-box domain-containing protein n=1 Tax=Microthyrium microscopicum TaxID=703497 RepID=A0A6A6URH5_9PEZI|nr:hypothetical protein BT63DRAFT_419320 [Microthyrium microscopicum]